MDQKTHLICESVQEVTLVAWPIVWADNKYDQDSRVVLEMLRDWGEEFENWWISHDEDWICDHDYIECVERYAEIKSRQYVLSMEPVEYMLARRERTVQEFTAIAVDRAHHDRVYAVLTEEMHMSRDKAFDTIRDIAEQYMSDCDSRDEEVDVFGLLDADPDNVCTESIAEYLVRAVAEMKREK